MPCRDYYDDHPEAYFGPKLKDAEEEIKQLKARVAFAESALCATLKAGDALCENRGFNFFVKIDFEDAGITSSELAEWQRVHNARDAKIRKIEKAKVTQKQPANAVSDKADGYQWIDNDTGETRYRATKPTQPDHNFTVVPLFKTKNVVPDGWKLVPINPPDTCIASMAVRSDHGLAIPGYYDDGLQKDPAGHTRRLEATMTSMRQLYEEAIGEGFYKHTPPTKD